VSAEGAIRVAIIAAMEREVAGLVKDWPSESIGQGSFVTKVWKRDGVVVTSVGTGYQRGFDGTNVVIEAYHPELITSVGFTGAIGSELTVGTVVVPAEVVRWPSLARYATHCGQGILVSANEVIGQREKSQLAAQLGATIVDMEAAGVAEAAAQKRTRFTAVKAVSDALGDEIRFVSKFVTPEGFRTSAFVAFIALRPWLWGAVGKLANNSSKAGAALEVALRELIRDPDEFMAKRTETAVLRSEA